MRRLTRAFAPLNVRFAAPALTRSCTGFAPTVAVSCRSGRAGQQASWPSFQPRPSGFSIRLAAASQRLQNFSAEKISLLRLLLATHAASGHAHHQTLGACLGDSSEHICNPETVEIVKLRTSRRHTA